MRRSLQRLKIPLLVTLLAAALAAGQATFIAPQDVPWETILTGPPAAGSDQERQEVAEVLGWQNKRTASDVLRCQSEDKPDPFIFSDVLGDRFNEVALPVTAALLNDTARDIKAITKLAKAKWERKRPPFVDDRIRPCVAIEENGSYPSAHAVRGIVWASILGEMFPDKKDQLMARGKLMGEDRVIAGIHFPSDVEAGQKLGEAIVDQLQKNPAFATAVSEAREECAQAGVGK